MKLIDFYFDYKSKNEKYLILMEIGTFVEVYGEDTAILNKLLGYKVKQFGVSSRTGFPTNSLKKIENILINEKINYIIIEKNKNVIKRRFNPNNYDKYRTNIDIDSRLNKIILKIKKNATRYDINEVLCEIEKLL